MDVLYSRYAAFIRPGDSVVLESGSSSFGISPMMLADDVQVHIQMGRVRTRRKEPDHRPLFS
jgi:indolepyruvate decarboxylase